MIFFPEKEFYEKPADYGFKSEDVFVQTADGIRLHGWFLEPPADRPELERSIRPVLLFFHGNAGNISHRLFKVKGWIERGFSVFLIDYRGYGKSEGEINHREDVERDAEAVFRWLHEGRKTQLSRILLYGESLGTFPALGLAVKFKAAALILEAPFTSFYELARLHYPFVPKSILKDFEFSNLAAIEEIKTPLFILHGMRDEICPYEMAGELFEKAPEPKVLFSVPEGMHNDLCMAAGEGYWQKPAEFVKKYLE